jgi:protein AATF/BFR2
LLIKNNIAVPPPKKRRKLESDATLDDYSAHLITATEDAAALEEVYVFHAKHLQDIVVNGYFFSIHPYMLQTLSKWSAKIQAVAPSTLLSSNRGAFSRGNQPLKSAIELIDENLADTSKLLERTQMIRNKKPRLGPPQEEPESEVIDAEIFDDTDFYQKMLRDIIDSRGSGLKNEDWQMLQKRKKSKKTVETKASKGRKLRYVPTPYGTNSLGFTGSNSFEIHEKIQNFMVPVPVIGAWHDDQIDELFSSVLGKGFENAVVDLDEFQVHPSADFRVFG